MRSIICHFWSDVASAAHCWNIATCFSHSSCRGSVASRSMAESQSKSSGASTIITSRLPRMYISISRIPTCLIPSPISRQKCSLSCALRYSLISPESSFSSMVCTNRFVGCPYSLVLNPSVCMMFCKNSVSKMFLSVPFRCGMNLSAANLLINRKPAKKIL